MSVSLHKFNVEGMSVSLQCLFSQMETSGKGGSGVGHIGFAYLVCNYNCSFNCSIADCNIALLMLLTLHDSPRYLFSEMKWIS